ncbi:MAG: HEPN domain-containing protein [Candidatus Omnitrophica bacterium CG11_big_fil_rev_8_21_14_0_20_42_13]|uniref:HEPN domain-containing protein n=1 Tax=Candidatus Ghiorseimicrobium undicola TaxID=1974746 RepID=A0A2H0M1C2_9BACT|nr:MAG: HEPN domain-containing protein [Candidatus Omnitrophica bacterium CG11_big_fil_rev_8_21_14_0_20_42_13]
MPFNYNDCMREGLLRKIPPSKDKATQSLKKAREWLKEAENSLKGDAFNSSILASYMVMFHAARTILFLDGFREKSHACVARYLEEKYVKTGKLDKKWVELLDHNREIRHNDQYDLSFFSTKEDAENALKSANDFFAAMESLFKTLLK